MIQEAEPSSSSSDDEDGTTHSREIRKAMAEMRHFQQQSELQNRQQQQRHYHHEGTPTFIGDGRSDTYGSPPPRLPSSSNYSGRETIHSPVPAAAAAPFSRPPGFNYRRIEERMSSPEMVKTPLGVHGEWTHDYDSPDDMESPDRLQELIVKRVDPLLQKHSNWTKIFASKAFSNSVPDVLKQYRLVQDLFDKYAGQRVPFKTTSKYKIEKVRYKLTVCHRDLVLISS